MTNIHIKGSKKEIIDALDEIEEEETEKLIEEWEQEFFLEDEVIESRKKFCGVEYCPECGDILLVPSKETRCLTCGFPHQDPGMDFLFHEDF